MPDPDRPTIAVFAHERGDARVVKRISALGDAGWRVIGFTFHRKRDKPDVPPSWENVHLGTTYNRRYLQRLGAFAGSLFVLWQNRVALRSCGVVYAINSDNALLALLAGWMMGGRSPLVLELADVQPAMTGGGRMAEWFRRAERFVLRRTALLVTTSPGFVRNYFKPVQGYEGEVFLLENKVYPSAGFPDRSSRPVAPIAGGRPWVIGCFGAFRCRRSLLLMRELSSALGENVRFILRGYPAGTLSEEFEALLGSDPNVVFEGAYTYPDDLQQIYDSVDINWAFDESDPSGNSAWLLPNRIYEGGFFGVPVVAGRSTETGRWIEQRGVGWPFDEPLAAELSRFLESLSIAEWQRVRTKCESLPRGEFCGEQDYRCLSERLMALCSAQPDHRHRGAK